MRLGTVHLYVAAAVFAPLAASIFIAAPDSPCSKYCGNVQSSTATDEMVCDDAGLASSEGVVWEQCISCLLTSTYVSGGHSDLQSLLYNLRFNVGYCLFGGGTNPCVTSTACSPLGRAVSYKNMSTSVGALDYCSKWDQGFYPPCSECLIPLQQDHLRGIYENNYVTILEAACEQRPDPGFTVSIAGDPFDPNVAVSIVEPHPDASSVPTPDYGPVSLGARVGIAFGGLAFILVVAGVCIVCNGKRRRRAFLRELERRHGGQGWPHPKTRYGGSSSSGGGPDMFETPVSQQPLRGWETESPVSAHTDAPFPRYFSPYSSQYASPVTSPEAPGSSHHQWPALVPQHTEQQQQQQFYQMTQTQSPSTHGSPPPAFSQWPTSNPEQIHAQHVQGQTGPAIGIALGGDEASLRSKASNLNLNGYPIDSKGKQRDEAYEMHEVESPYGYGNGTANGNASWTGNGNGDSKDHRPYEYPFSMPAEPQAPVLHHPGYGRHHGSRPGPGGADAGAGVVGVGQYPDYQRGYPVS
ncbi:uncharacterized protein P884DRAFT_220386 [Thermothelomyces heterothallicus CBS 202.75]|uniref:uncharacterized protein n=1 Tax=Thermothelomyces heterothallicus CBS 202.75 TaxID=1149848 RepID=UPI0037433ABD